MHRLLDGFAVVALNVLLALSWATVALAQADGNGDAFDGDELGLVPIALGIAVVGYLAWLALRRRSRNSG
jgi:hypothetical protein